MLDELAKNKLLEGIAIKKEKIDFSIADRKIFSKAEDFERVIKEIHELLKALASYSSK